MRKLIYTFLIIANLYIWGTIYFDEPTQWAGRTDDGMYVSMNIITMRCYLSTDEHSFQIVQKAKCDSIVVGNHITAYVNGFPIATIMGERAYSEKSWKINRPTKRKLVVKHE